MPSRFTAERIDAAIETLTRLRDRQIALARASSGELERIPGEYRPSALNLLHYLAMRQHDLRPLQRELSSLGLSSLGRTEAHGLAGVDAVLAALHMLAGRSMSRPEDFELPVDFATGPQALERHTEGLLGPASSGRAVRIMVTMPAEAASSYGFVRDLLLAGMNVMRINSAHDDLPAWTRMVEHLRRAVAETGRACRVLFDLQGPKLRTGDIAPGPAVVRWSPRRGVRGEVLRPIRVRLAPAGRLAPPDHDVLLPFEGDWPHDLAAGDEIFVADCRGKARSLRVLAVDAAGALAESHSTVYVESGAECSRRPATAAARGTGPTVVGVIGALPPSEPAIVLRRGDLLWVTGSDQPGRPASRDTDGQCSVPASIPCTLPQVFTSVEAGQRILFDDGKLGGVVERVSGERLEVRITQARARGERLRADKGINLPDSRLALALLSEADLVHLDFAVTYADMVGLSFVRAPEDVLELERELDRRGGSELGIVLKIETRAAFERLPALLLTALRSPPVGVMVARGDLGVELGFERLAEVQEQVLWLCEAAHVPVIWATQVLESLAKKGRPSRAEVTDAAMSGRAECVMLNKGPHVLEAVRFLDDVMERMQAHQSKKRSTLRRLSVSAGVEDAT